MITPFHNLSNKELVQQLEAKRGYSPLIDELCQRIENFHVCPVCNADVQRSLKKP